MILHHVFVFLPTHGFSACFFFFPLFIMFTIEGYSLFILFTMLALSLVNACYPSSYLLVFLFSFLYFYSALHLFFCLHFFFYYSDVILGKNLDGFHMIFVRLHPCLSVALLHSHGTKDMTYSR